MKTMYSRAAFRRRGEWRLLMGTVQRGYWPDTQRHGTLMSLDRPNFGRSVQLFMTE